MAKKMRTINNPLDRQTRNDINYNFETLESDLSDGIENINEKLDDALDGRQLEELFDAATDARKEAESARNQSAYANEKGNYADEKGNYASEQGDYAKAWGDYAKEKGEYTAEKTAEIEQAHTDLSQIKVDAVDATQKANTQAEYAKEQAEYAKAVSEDVDGKMVDIDNAISLAIQKGQETEQQGLIAKEQGDYAQSVIDSYKHVGDWQGSMEYKKNQEVLFNGSTYRALDDSKGTQPTDKSKWQLIAQRGVDGEGAVGSVNGIMPDMDGNVDLGDIASKEYVDNKINSVDLSTLETKVDAQLKFEETKEELLNHSEKNVGETEVHGMRVNEDSEFQFFKNGDWHTIEGGGTISVAAVSELKAVSDAGATELTITWTNPTNEEFQKTEIYKSDKLLNIKKPEEVKTQGELLYSGTEETTDTSTKHDETTYVYAIAYHNVVGAEVMSDVIMVSITAKDTIPPAPITEFALSVGDQTISGTWVNPTNNDFEKVKIVYKMEGYPIDEFDGMVAYEGSSTSFEVTGLINGTEYFFRAFTFDENGNKNDDETQMAQATPVSHVLYGVEIDENNSDPFGAVRYIEESTDFEPLFSGNGTANYGSWADKFPINRIKVVLLKNGEVVEELDKNDYRKTIDGRSVDITSGNAGDVMIGIPLTFWKFERVGSKLRIYVSDGQPDDGFEAYAHSRDGVVQDDYLYVGAFKGTVQEGKLRSLHDAMSTASETIGKFREYANSNGLGYGQMNWATMTLLQIYSVLLSKSLDSQTALGEGYTNGNSEYIKNGATVAKGLFYGESSGKEQMKFLGLEDFYGNRMEWVDGLVTSPSRDILINDKNINYNDSGSGYTKHGECFSSSGYIKTIEGTTGTGFLPTDTNGSSSTYYCDNAYQSSSGGRVASFGGILSSGSVAGAFRLDVYDAPSDSFASQGARCLFLKFLKDDI